jgi:hypothetical protein
VAAVATAMVAAAVASAWTSPPHLQHGPGALQQDGGYATADGSNLHDGAFKGTRLCFHHYSYEHQATRCKPPCLFQQGNGAAASNN